MSLKIIGNIWLRGKQAKLRTGGFTPRDAVTLRAPSVTEM
jgi:hypothetical protein